jgi:hypothetical protein
MFLFSTFATEAHAFSSDATTQLRKKKISSEQKSEKVLCVDNDHEIKVYFHSGG